MFDLGITIYDLRRAERICDLGFPIYDGQSDVAKVLEIQGLNYLD